MVVNSIIKNSSNEISNSSSRKISRINSNSKLSNSNSSVVVVN